MKSIFDLIILLKDGLIRKAKSANLAQKLKNNTHEKHSKFCFELNRCFAQFLTQSTFK